MKKISVLGILCLLNFAPLLLRAQMVGDNIFLPGHYIQAAIAPNGSFGSTIAASSFPSGYFHDVTSAISVYDHATGSSTSTTTRLALIYDAGHDGWTTGTPNYFGDYTLPGSPYEGWDLQIGTASGSGTTNQAHAWYTNYQSGSSGFSGGLAMSGSLTSYSNTGGVITAVWTGTAGTSGALAIVQTTTLDTDASWINVTTTFRNTTSSSLGPIYYQRAFDPDNDAYASGGSTTTHDTINYQNDYLHRVEVTASGYHYRTQTIALATKDCRAKCWSGSWPTYSGYSVQQYYTGSGTGTNVIYSGSQTADNSIGLTYSLGTLPAGDSTSISYAFIFNGSHGIDSSVSEPYIAVNGGRVDSLDTVFACQYSGDTLFLNVMNGNTRNWSHSLWQWSPDSSLFADTGVNNGILMANITSTITYTIEGTDSALGSCEHKIIHLTIVPSTTTAPTVSDITYCVGDTPSPLTAIGTSLLWYTSSSSGTGSSTAPTPSTATAGTTTYYVSSTSTACESIRVPLNVIVVSHPSAITVPGSICNGAGFTLSDSLSGGSWSSSNTSVATIDASSGSGVAVSTGVTVITYMTTGGCSVTDSITVNPSPSTITGANNVCQGYSTSLSATPSGGTWASSSSTITTVTTSGSVTGVVPGYDTISYSFAGCSSWLPFTVNATPGALSGPSTVCAGSSITLSASMSGTWTSSNTSVATVNSSGVVRGVSSGNTVITFRTTAGCTVTDTITVNPLPGVITGPTSVCETYTITLSTSSTTGSWSSSASGVASVSSGGVVTGVSAGTSTISYTFSTGCYRTAPVTVYSAPAAITGSSFLCAAGGTTTLSDATTGGRWTSSNTSIATVNSSGLVTGGTAGIAIITYTKTSTGCYMTDTVHVNPLPKVVNGPSAVCVGSTITLSDTVTGGSWSSSNTSVATVNAGSGVVTGVTSGTTTIVYYLGTGCTISKTITVNPLPASITGTLAVCEAGSVTTLSDASTPGTWSSNNNAIATVNASTGDVTGVSAGTDQITFTLTTTGCYVTVDVTVNPLPADISGPTAVCVGSTISLTDGGSGSWASSNTALATITSTGVVTGVSNGTDVITYTLGTGCIKTLSITVNPLPGPITGTLSVCQGQVTGLSDGGGGSWNSGNISIATVDGSGNVYGVAPGTSLITYTLGTGCQTTTSVTVNPLPATITGSPDVCYTYTTLLNETTGGGTWSSANSAIATVSGGLVTGVSVGGTTISYTLTATGCYTTISMTVNALPSAISGPTHVCAGSSVTLVDGTVGSGTWSSSNTSVATIDPSTGVARGIIAGTTTITFTGGGGCFVYTTLTVDPLPAAIGGTPVVCEGSTVNLTDASAGGSWSSSNTSLATVTGGSGSPTTVTGVLAGGLTITYTLPTTCFITTAFTVNTTPVAITGTTDVCEAGSTTRLYDATTGGLWSSGNPTIGTVVASNGIVTGVAAGTVTLSYTLGACYNTTSVHVRPLPGATITPIGDTMLCPGDFATLTANTGTGYTYQWSNSGGPISGETDDYYMVPSGATGGFSVSVTSGYGCNSSSVPMSISIAPAVATLTASSTSFCSGLSSPLLANTGTGLSYQWLRSGIGISGATSYVYNATLTGNYQVIVTNASGCTATSTSISMTMLPAPASTLTAHGPLTFCTGDSVTLTADTGTAITYQWMNGGSTIAGATNINFTTNATGTYQVQETNGYGCQGSSAIASVTALALPYAAITAAGSTTFCAGGNVTLSTSSSGAGTTYQWYHNGAAVSGATNVAYTASTTGYYIVKVTAPTGCVNTTSTAMYVESVSVPLITPYGGTTFCWGSSALLGVGVATTAAVSYQWQKEGINITGATNSRYTATVSGHYSCLIHVAGGCNTAAYAVTITELPLPNPIVYYDGTFLSTGGFYVNYEWFRNMVPLSGNGSKFIPTESGDYTVKVIDSNGCQSISTIYVLRTLGNSRAPLGIKNLTASDINVYPNPATEVLHVDAPQPVNAVIAAMDGRRISETNDAKEINISNLAQGMYMIMVYDKEGQMVKVQQFVKN